MVVEVPIEWTNEGEEVVESIVGDMSENVDWGALFSLFTGGFNWIESRAVLSACRVSSLDVLGSPSRGRRLW